MAQNFSIEIYKQIFWRILGPTILAFSFLLNAVPGQALTPGLCRQGLVRPTTTVESSISIKNVGQKIQGIVNKMYLYWEGRRKPIILHKEDSWKLKALRVLQSTYNGPIRFLTPVIPLPLVENPVDKIITKKYLDPNYQLQPSELETLRKYDAEDIFNDNVAFQKKSPKWSSFRRLLGRAMIVAMTLNSALVANWALHLSDSKALVPVTDFIQQEQYRLQPNQARIYNESVPFPHMAIEMDGKVYSYGQTHLSIKTAQEYLLADEIQNAAIGKNTATKNESSFSLYGVLDKTGLNKLPRSVQMVTLNLDLQQKSNLKRYLELSEHQAYRNQTLIMDCSSMITLALAHNTDTPLPMVKGFGLDASPSSMMMYFGALKSAGTKNSAHQDLIGDIKQVAMDQADRPQLHLWRNLYINAIEGKIFWSFLNINLPFRAYMNMRYNEADFQYLEPQVKQELMSWQKSISMEISDPNTSSPIGNQIQILIADAQALGQVQTQDHNIEWQSKAANFQAASTYFLDREIMASREIVQSSDSAFADVVRSSYRLQILLAYKTYLNQTLTSGNKISALQQIDFGNAEKILNEILASRYVGKWK